MTIVARTREGDGPGPDRCPCCRSVLSTGRENCQGCGIALVRPDGFTIARIDCVYAKMVERNRRRVLPVTCIVATVAAVACAVSSVTTGPLHVLVSAPVILGLHIGVLVWAFLWRVGAALRARRRFTERLTRRLFLYPLALVGYAAGGVPVAGFFIGGATAVALNLAVYTHVQRILRLEYDRKPLALDEKLLAWTAAGCAVSLLILLAVTAISGLAIRDFLQRN